jgi:hypothetical protein
VSVWASAPHPPSLKGVEGDLVSFTVRVNPRDLEDVLEALANLEFPVNPQIYHHAEISFYYADGSETHETVTLVEFPGYASWADDVRRALDVNGFDSGVLHVNGMLEEIHSDGDFHPAPPGAPYQYLRIVKRSHLAARV